MQIGVVPLHCGASPYGLLIGEWPRNVDPARQRGCPASRRASQASGRAFSFDTLASELISGVEVFKSSVARLQSGGVGSAINIRTARPFDYSGFKLSTSLDANYVLTFVEGSFHILAVTITGPAAPMTDLRICSSCSSVGLAHSVNHAR